MRILQGTTIGVIKEDTRSLDYGSYVESFLQTILKYYDPESLHKALKKRKNQAIF